jgi:hypothetical protein
MILFFAAFNMIRNQVSEKQHGKIKFVFHPLPIFGEYLEMLVFFLVKLLEWRRLVFSEIAGMETPGIF